MPPRILITGGAGFIGSHLADHLLDAGYRVRVLDCLLPQVHGQLDGKRPEYLHRDVELIVGDVRSHDDVNRALQGIDAVFHFAARVGVGQSMYRIAEYTSVNNLGTAVLFEHMIERRIERVIVASSMSIYGEGRYRAADGAIVDDAERTAAQLKRGEWDPCRGGRPLAPVPTDETKPPRLASVYALSKFDQERLALLLGEAYDLPTVALRFFNVYGTRQALSNPYTGVLAIFASRLLNEQPPVIFEDGRQTRDFVSVHDIVEACRLALEAPADRVRGQAINVGSGTVHSVFDIAAKLAATLGSNIEPQVSGRARIGDIRHCVADISLARRALGYEPKTTLESGLVELSGWLLTQPANGLAPHAASRELEARGLVMAPPEAAL